MMTDAHCHYGATAARHFLCEPFAGAVGAQDVVFYGTHPWYLSAWQGADALHAKLSANPRAGVGEIGLDRLKDKTISAEMRAVFTAQLEVAAALRRPVVLHGAKCWGEVVQACLPYQGQIPAFLFHGFSRSGGLLPTMRALNGFISVGAAVLNDHAVNYRQLVAEIPSEMLLLETDATAETQATLPPLTVIVEKIAALRNTPSDVLAAQIECNTNRYIMV